MTSADDVREFIDGRVVPAEPVLARGGPPARAALAELRAAARAAGLWALPLPAALGGAGLTPTRYAPLARAEGRSDFGPAALGSDLLLDATMLDAHGTPAVRDAYLAPLLTGDHPPSFAMTEPGVAGTDPAALACAAARDGDHWVITGRKWFTSRAADAAFTTVVCRTAPDALSLLVVPTGAPGYRIVRELPVLGAGGQYEIALDAVRVPADHLLGEPGAGLRLIGARLALGRTLRCLRWLGQADRAHELMLHRMRHRRVGAGPLADRQLLHGYVFANHAELLAATAATDAAVAAVESGADTRIAVATAKVLTARAYAAIVDRAIQVHGAEGLSDDTPLALLHRTARAARILDGPDELHITTVARRLLRG
ncbi:acyl-CoA dehydrogenase [Pilimelia anulata]|uniref:Acyl-CoA dehydrogenase n=1 Tax=Pilimelia anulata TaxID=53371 RepID=A0A8J3F6T8_9ACTN|nr:acyl-CoA dehydrogenase family protein [Pilimelia anulata]GGJ83066.1 acyl-CoA dehydrogenase [Pilimelia anulata]